MNKKINAIESATSVSSDSDWLADYAQAEVIQIDKDPTHAQFTTGNKGKYKSNIYSLCTPKRLQNDPLCLAIIGFCKSEVFLGGVDSYRRSKSRVFTDLFDFLDKQYTEQEESDLTAIHPDYINHLKQSTSPTCIAAKVASINVALKWYVKNGTDKEAVTRVNAIQKRIPKISSHRSGVRKSLSQLSELEYDDQTLLMSLRLFCIILLKKYREHREYFRSVPDITEAQNKLANLDEELAKYICDGKPQSIPKNLVETYFKPIWNAIYTSGDPILIERLLLNTTSTLKLFRNSSEPWTREHQSEILKGYLTLEGTLSRDYNGPICNFKWLSYNELVSPCHEEKALMSWLLASERIQPSGQTKLTIKDYSISGDIGSWDYTKERSTHKEHTTQMYKQGSAIYEIYNEYIKLIAPASDMGLGQTPSSRQMRLRYNNTPYTLILSVIHKGSYTGKFLVEEHPGTKPIIDLIKTVCENNEVILNDRKSRSKALSFGLSYIAQSTAISTQKRGIRDKQSPFEMFSQSDVEAALNAHTPDVRQNIYINRSETVTRINERKWFAEVVSEEMVKDARNLMEAQANSKACIISLTEARSVLGLRGLKSSTEEINILSELLDSCKKFDAKPGNFGDIKINEETLIIELPITAALMISYQSALEQFMREQTALSDRRKAYFLSRYLYVDGLLDQFEPTIIESGKNLLSRYKIPAPPIFVDSL